MLFEERVEKWLSTLTRLFTVASIISVICRQHQRHGETGRGDSSPFVPSIFSYSTCPDKGQRGDLFKLGQTAESDQKSFFFERILCLGISKSMRAAVLYFEKSVEGESDLQSPLKTIVKEIKIKMDILIWKPF